MSRRPRLDAPGVWHHVMNRGIARRTLFEYRADIRFFLSRLAHAVRHERLEVHAFCVMTTHFHLLVRSLDGAVSEVMRGVQLDYVRRFNRARRRDGPLVRGRFASKPVLSTTYRKVLVRYIDRNPVQAGICATPSEYPFGSSSCYARQRGPPWLERSWVEAVVRSATGDSTYDPVRYPQVFRTAGDSEASLVERRLDSPEHVDPLDDLIGSTPARVLAWMRRKALMADGTEPGLAVVDAACVDRAVSDARVRGVERLLRLGRLDLLTEIHAGLLRSLAGASLVEIGTRIGRSTSGAAVVWHRHANRLAENEAYAQHASRLAQAALGAQYGAMDSTSMGAGDRGTV